MRLIKLLLGLLVLAVVGGVIAAITKTVKRGPKKPAATLSYDAWPTVPRKPAPSGAA